MNETTTNTQNTLDSIVTEIKFMRDEVKRRLNDIDATLNKLNNNLYEYNKRSFGLTLRPRSDDTITNADLKEALTALTTTLNARESTITVNVKADMRRQCEELKNAIDELLKQNHVAITRDMQDTAAALRKVITAEVDVVADKLKGSLKTTDDAVFQISTQVAMLQNSAAKTLELQEKQQSQIDTLITALGALAAAITTVMPQPATPSTPPLWAPPYEVTCKSVVQHTTNRPPKEAKAATKQSFNEAKQHLEEMFTEQNKCFDALMKILNK